MTRISNEEAQALLEQGARYLDVRTIEEFQEGHVPGALNVPLRLSAEGGMVDNPDFVAVAEVIFDKEEPLVVGCRSGARSAAAVALLDARGFRRLHDLTAGFSGSRDAFGRPLAGWQQEGRVVETEATSGQAYPALRERAGL